MSDSKRRAPAFLLYVDDFLAGTSDMSCEEVGAYIRLLCHQWTKGSIPNDEERATRMAGLMGSPSLRYVLAKFALCDDGNRRNTRLETVRTERDKFLLQQAENGRKGAEKRWGNGDSNGDPNGKPIATPLATPMADACPKDSSPSPSPIPSPIPIPLNPLTPLQGEAASAAVASENKPSATSVLPEGEKPQGDGTAREIEAFKIRVGSMLRRRTTTAWSPKEMKALEAVRKLKTPEEDILALEKRYATNDKYLRRDILQLLNNWNGEIDRARNGTASGPNHPGNGANGNPRNEGIAGFDGWHREFQARAVGDGQHGPWDDFGRGPEVASANPEAGRVAPPADCPAGSSR